MDELLQAKEAWYTSILHGSSESHQPPLDFLLQGTAMRIFGVNELGIRIHAVFFSAAAFIGMLIVSLFITPRIYLAFFGSGLFFLHFTIAQYGYEARPISSGIFTIILTVGHVFLLFETPMNSPLLVKTPLRAFFLGAAGTFDSWATAAFFLTQPFTFDFNRFIFAPKSINGFFQHYPRIYISCSDLFTHSNLYF